MLIQEEKQREIQSSGLFLTDSASLAVESQRSQQSYRGRMNRNDTFNGMNTDRGRFDRTEGRKAGLFCNYCKKAGHVIEKCYKLHGFPPNSRFRGGKRTAAHVQSGPLEFGLNSQDSMSHTAAIVPGLTAEQSSQLVALLQNIQLS